MNISRNEAAAIRAELKLRRNDLFDCWEVYSTIHKTGIFRWFKISEETKNWYVKHFPDIKYDKDLSVDEDSGAVIHTTLAERHEAFLRYAYAEGKQNG